MKPSPALQALAPTEESLSETGGAPRAETGVADTTVRPAGRFFGRRTGPGASGQDRGCASLRMTPFAGFFFRIWYETCCCEPGGQRRSPRIRDQISRMALSEAPRAPLTMPSLAPWG